MSDDEFHTAYVDADEWRDAPVRHRYVHGGFTGTETRFSIYLPPDEQYGGRFFQHVTPVPDSEHLAQSATGEAGQDRVLDRQRGVLPGDERRWRVGRPGSVGGPDDRGVSGQRRRGPALAGHRRGDVRRAPPVRVPLRRKRRRFSHHGRSREHDPACGTGSCPTSSARRWRSPTCSRSACTPNDCSATTSTGSSTPSSPAAPATCSRGSTPSERDALLEVTRMGFPPRSWFGHRTMGMHAFPILYGAVVMADPSYFEAFWTEPGYLGHERPPSLLRDVVQHRCEVAATISAQEAVDLGLDVGAQPGQARRRSRYGVARSRRAAVRPRGRTALKRSRTRRCWGPS